MCIPLNVESSAIPHPVAPPPITSISYSSPPRNLASCSDLIVTCFVAYALRVSVNQRYYILT